MTILPDCWDTIIIYVMWATIMQPFNLFAALIVTIFQQNIQLAATFEHLQWTSKNYLTEERVSNPKKTLSDKLDFFGVKYTSQQKLFKNLAIFDFESICVQEESFKDTKITTWTGKHIPISVSIFPNLAEAAIFLYNYDPHHLVSLFIGTLEGLASQSKGKKKLLFLDNETTNKIELGSILEKLTPGHNRREHARFDMSQDDCDNEICASTHFLQIQENWLIDLQESLERYCNVLPVFVFNSAKTIWN